MNYEKDNIDIWKVVRSLLIIIILSSIHPYITSILYIYLIFYAIKSPVNAMKSIIIAFTIFFLNPGIVKINSTVQLIRWILLFVSLGTIVFKSRNVFRKQNFLFLTLGYIWILYNLTTSIFNSPDILTSIMKIISFSVSFFIIVSYIDTHEYDWKKWMIAYHTIIIIASIPLLFSPIGKLRNGVFFQGIWNHPNGFSVMLSTLSILAIYTIFKKEYYSYKNIILFNLLISIPMMMMTESRTGMLSFSLSMLIFIIINIKENVLKNIKITSILKILGITILTILTIIVYKEEINTYIKDMIYKGAEGNILYSSQKVLDRLEDDIKSKPIFGNGFGVDTSRESTGDFKLSNPTEKRNVILAVWAEAGIVGFLIFILLLITLIHPITTLRGILKQDALFLVLLLVNMSEMMFFSANGIGIFIYFMFGVYRSEVYTDIKI